MTGDIIVFNIGDIFEIYVLVRKVIKVRYLGFLYGEEKKTKQRKKPKRVC